MTLPVHGHPASRTPGGDASTWSGTGRSVVDRLPGTRSIALAPLTEREVRDLRRLGREARSFDRLAEEIMRAQLTLAVMPPDDDPEALRGLRRKERLLLLEALSLGAADPDGLRLAATLTRCVADAGDNLTAMLAAALENNCVRQGLMTAQRSRGDVDA